MYGIIYKATGPDGRVYVGKTERTLAKRKSEHAFMAKKGDKRIAFQIALLEHGVNAFAWEQIDTFESEEELDYKEQYWISYYKANSPQYGYNDQGGGTHYSHSAETRKKISENMKGINTWQKGRKASEETRRKMSDSAKNISTETRRKMSAARKSRIVLPETRRKISEAKKGEKHPLYGKNLSEEHRQKLRVAQKGAKNPAVKITEITARQIKIDLQNKMKVCDVVRKYGVSSSIVENIKRGKTWVWLETTA